MDIARERRAYGAYPGMRTVHGRTRIAQFPSHAGV